MFWNQYPYINLNDLNLDYLLNKLKALEVQLVDFIKINTIKYADPIQWNITTQYEANTVVIDGNTGTAYLSTQPVPSGVALTNTDYWTVIFTLDLLSANQNITFRNDGANVIATFESNVDDWLLWNSQLYKVIRHIAINEAYVEGYNLDRYSVELFIKDYISNLENIIGALSDLTTSDTDSIVDAINSIITERGALSDLTTTDKTSIVDAINEVNSKPQITPAFVNVNAMINADVSVGDICYTLGYYSAGDNGGAKYLISNTSDSTSITLNNGLYANLVYDDSINIAQLGAQNNSDATSALTLALSLVNTVVIPQGVYNIASGIDVQHKTLIGEYSGLNQDDLPTLTLNAPIAVRGRGNVIKNLHLVSGNVGAGTAIELLTTTGDTNHVNQSEFDNLIIDSFEYGFYSACVLWNNIFKFIRVNFCDYAFYKNDSYDCFGNTFINFYPSGSKHANIVVNRFSATFINGIFGFSVLGAIRCTSNCNIEFIGCNFECDKHISDNLPDGYNSMMVISGGSFKFIGCLFAPNMDASYFIMQGGAGLRKASFECCYYNGSVSGNLADSFISQSAVPAAVYGAIEFDEGCNGIPEQMSGTSHPLPNSYKPYVVYKYLNNIINIGSEGSADTTKLSAGRIVYDRSANAIKMYNGSAFVAL